MSFIKGYLDLLRVRQWYKNIVIFLAIFFSGNLGNSNYLYLTFMGFLSLCFVSSASYIINDLADLKQDQQHPEKKQRLLPAGRISKAAAVILSIILLTISLAIASALPLFFLYAVLALFVITQLYTFFLKNIVLADILTIGALFVIRAVSGAYVIKVKISPWLILCPFFLSLLLSVGKRHADLLLLKQNAHKTRTVLKEYNQDLTNALMLIATTLLVISYTLYSFLSQYQNFLYYTLPFALFVIFRYFYLIYSGSRMARHPEQIIKDKQMVVGITLWVIITILLIYLG